MVKSLHSARHKLLASEIAEQRKRSGLSQAYVASQMGRHQPFIANIESGERRIDLIELLQLSEIISLDITEVIRKLRSLPS